jgi:hypothetical protein
MQGASSPTLIRKDSPCQWAVRRERGGRSPIFNRTFNVDDAETMFGSSSSPRTCRKAAPSHGSSRTTRGRVRP